MKKLITITILSFTIVWGLQRPTTRPSGRPSSRLEYQQLQAQQDKDSLHFVFEPDSLFLHLGETGEVTVKLLNQDNDCLLYTSPSPRDATLSRMPSSA